MGNEKKNRKYNSMLKIKLLIAILTICIPYHLLAQHHDEITKRLINHGFENVGVEENDSVRTIVLQPTPYNIVPDGVNAAIRIINECTQNDSTKSNQIIVLENNVPQFSVLQNCANSNWTAYKDLGIKMKELNKIKKSNRSFGKVDFVIYPEFFFKNVRLSVMYEILLNLNPTLEVSLWKGMKFTGQMVLPIVNQYGEYYNKVRPGIVTLSQSFRLPWRTNVTLSAGFFSDFRHGLSMYGEHYLKRNALGQFWLDGRIDYTKPGRWDGWKYIAGSGTMVTGYAGVNYFWKKQNVQLSLRGHRFLLGEYGLRAEALRHFRFVTIGLYASKIQDKPYIAHNGVNGGFMFALNFPPRKSKRHGYWPRFAAGDMDLRYNAGGDKRYGFYFVTSPNDNVRKKINSNTDFIQNYIQY